MGMEISPETLAEARRKVEGYGEKVATVSRANAEPFPGPMAAAFCTGAITIGDIAVRKVVASDWIALKAIESPLLKLIAEWQANPTDPKEVQFSEQDQWNICWLFTHEPKEARSELSGGKEQFEATAQEQVADKMDNSIIGMVMAAVMEQLKRNWLTALKHAADLEEKGEISFFRDAGEKLKMALAGG